MAAAVESVTGSNRRPTLLGCAFDNIETGDPESLKKAAREFSILLSLSPHYLPALLGLQYLLITRPETTARVIRWGLPQLIRDSEARLKTPEGMAELALCPEFLKLPPPTLVPDEEISSDPEYLWQAMTQCFAKSEFKHAAETAGQLLNLTPTDPLVIVIAHLFLRCDELFSFLYPEASYPYYDNLHAVIAGNEIAFSAILRGHKDALIERLSGWEEGPFKAVLLAEIHYHVKAFPQAKTVLDPYLKRAHAHPYAQYLYARFLLQRGVAQLTAARKTGNMIVLDEADLKRKEAMWNLFEQAGRVIGSAKADYADLWLSQKTPEALKEAVDSIRASMEMGSDSAAYYLGQCLMSAEGKSAYKGCMEEGLYCLVNAANISPDTKEKRDALFAEVRKIVYRETAPNPLLMRMRTLRDQDSPVFARPVGVISPYALCCEAIALFQSGGPEDLSWVAAAAKKLILAIGLERPYYLPALFLYEMLLHAYPILLQHHPHWTMDTLGLSIQILAQRSFDEDRDFGVFAGFRRSSLMQLVRLRYIDYIRLKEGPYADSLFKLQLWREVEKEQKGPLFLYYLSRHLHEIVKANNDFRMRAESKRLLERAEDLPIANHALAMMYASEGNEAMAQTLLMKAAEKDLPESLCALAHRYACGAPGLKQDLKLALQYFDQAGQWGDKEAAVEYAKLAERIHPGKSKAAQRRQTLRAREIDQRVAKHHATKEDHLAKYHAYKTGSNGCAVDPELALYHCVKAVDYDSKIAMVYLLEAYRDGFGVAQDVKRATCWLDFLIQLGVMSEKPRISGEEMGRAAEAQNTMPPRTEPTKPLHPTRKSSVPESIFARAHDEGAVPAMSSARLFSPAAFAKLSSELAHAHAQIHSLKAAAVQAQEEAAVARERVAQKAAREAAAVQAALEALQAENEALKKQAENRSRKLQERSAEIAQLSAERDALAETQQRAAAEAQSAAAAAAATIAELRRQIAELCAQTTALSAELTERRADVVSLGRQLDAIRSTRVLRAEALAFVPSIAGGVVAGPSNEGASMRL